MHKSLSPRPGRCRVQPCTFYVYLPSFIPCITGVGGIPRFLGIYPEISVCPKALYRDFWVYRSLYPNVTNIYKMYTKYQAAAARPGFEAPGPALGPRLGSGPGSRRLVFCIYLVYICIYLYIYIVYVCIYFDIFGCVFYDFNLSPGS